MKSDLDHLIQLGMNPVHLSGALCLFWIAYSDGEIDAGEQKIIDLAFEQQGYYKERLLELVRQRDTRSLTSACKHLRMRLTDQGKVGFTTLVIQLAVIDGLLSLSENHLIRLFADVLDIGAVGLDMIYEQVTGSKLPQPGDPSSIQWWEERTQQARQRAEQEQRQRESQDQADQREQAQGSQRESNGRRSQAGMSTAEAYVVLGLRPDATPEEITKVYRRAAQSHHPDRFAELGPEAQRAAHEMFLRIKAAYEVLA